MPVACVVVPAARVVVPVACVVVPAARVVVPAAWVVVPAARVVVAGFTSHFFVFVLAYGNNVDVHVATHAFVSEL